MIALHGVTAVTVTYGMRHRLVLETVRRALAAGVDEVLVVDNGCSAESRTKLAAGIADSDRVHLVAPALNRGSAVGFADGINLALARGPEFLWLLDDDNWVHKDALDALLVRLPLLERGSALCSLRTTDALQMQVAAGTPVADVYPQPGDFFGISVSVRLRQTVQRVRKLGRVVEVESLPRESAAPVVPFAPYGGFFAAASTFASLGLPDPSFFLYEDDTEYSERIAKQGGRITLVTESRVDDADGKWSDGDQRSGIARLLNAADEYRLFYATRNRARVDVERARRHGRTLVLYLNFSAFLGAVVWRGLTLRRPRRAMRMIAYLITGMRQAARRP